ncbi:hypothetical protein [Blautia sp.]|uniref:hypothetical protein n=1 Tax=Blautia sp. TaxID=1955243 RepID=UPI00258D0D9C|nr:hypothetical protein [Blautia sp.]
MLEILRKTLYFTLFQFFIWLLIAVIREPSIYSPVITIKHYIVLTLLFDGIFAFGLLQEKKRAHLTMTLRKLKMFRVFILFYAAITAVLFYLQKDAVLSLLFLLIGYFLMPAYTNSNLWCCPKCGKRYGMRIWFSNYCPHCKKRLDNAPDSEQQK